MTRLTPIKRVLFEHRLIHVLSVLFGVFVFSFISWQSPQLAYAASSNTINFQARLQTASGAIVPDGYYNIEFQLYNASSGGTALWTEDYTSTSGPGGTDARVQTINGYFSVQLGSITSFPSTIDWSQQLYLTMNVGGTGTSVVGPSSANPTGWDGAMNPRLPLTAVPYAFQSQQAAQATELSSTNVNGTSTLSFQGSSSGNQSFVIQDQGAAGTYNLLTQNQANNSYIQLQGSTPGTAQTGNFNISGTGVVGTELYTPILDAATSGGTLSIGSTNSATGILNLGTTTTTGAIAIGGVSQTGSLTVGDSTLTNSIGIGTGSTASGDTQTVNIGTGGLSGATTNVTIGSTASGGALTTQAEGISNTLTGSATAPSDVVKTATNSTTALQVQNASGYQTLNVNTINGTTTLGNITTTTGSGVAGSLSLADGTSDGFGATINTTTLTANQTITIPNASGTVCLDAGNCHATYSKTATAVVAMGATTGCTGTVPVESSDPKGADYVDTSCTSAQTTINSAISAVSAAGGGIVYLEDGTYIISGSVTIASNVTLEGAGANTVIELENGANAAVTMINIGSSTSNVVVKDLTLNGNKANQTSGSTYGVNDVTNSTPGVQLNHLSVENMYGSAYGVMLAGSGTGSDSVTNSYIASNAGIGVYSSTANAFIADNVITGNSGKGIDVTGAGTTITSNTVTSNSSYGIYATSGKGMVVSNNTIASNTSYGMYLLGAPGLSVTGNSLTNNAGGINEAASNAIISGNTLTNNTTFGIDLESGSTGDVVEDNTISLPSTGAYDGIYVSNTASGNSVTNNTILGNGGTGVAIYTQAGALNTYLSGNSYSGTGATTISDNALSTRYGSQLTNNGDLAIQNDGATVIGSTLQGGATLSVTGGYTSSQLTAPNWGFGGVNYGGTSGATTWGYEVTALDGTGETVASTQKTITNGNATLSSTNYNTVTFQLEPGAIKYNIYRTTAGGTPNTTGLVTTITAGTLTATNGTVTEPSNSDLEWKDTGFAATAITPPSTNTTAGINIAGALDSAVLGGTLSIGSTNSATGILNLGTTTTTGAIAIGGVSQTGSLTVGDSTLTNSIGIGTGSTASGDTQTVNIGTGGLSGATTNVTIGSTASGGALTTQAEGISNTLTGSATAPSDVVKTATNSTTALQVQNASGYQTLNVNTINGTTTLGNITTTTGSGVAGSLSLADGTSDGFGATINTTTLTANQTITLPNASGTVCLDSQNCSTAGSGYILNQSATPGTAQTGNFNISGAGIVGTELYTPILDAATSGGTLFLGDANTYTGSIVVGYGMSTGGITLGSGGGTGTITVGKSTATNTVDIGNGSTASGSTQTINIAASGLSGATTNVTIGSTASGGTLALQAEGITNTMTGSATAPSEVVKSTTNSTTAFQIQNSSGVAVLNADTTNARIGIGTATPNATLDVAGDTYLGDKTLTANDQAEVCLFGNSTCSYAQAGAYNSMLQIFGGAGQSRALQLYQTVNGSAYIDATYSTLELMTSATSTDINLSPTGSVTIGSGSTPVASPTIFVLASGSSSTDPTTVINGGMYYNSTMKSFRCGQNGMWVSCSGLVASSTTVPSAITGTSTYTSLGDSYTIPANDCQPGVTYVVNAGGQYWTNGQSGTSLSAAVFEGSNNIAGNTNSVPANVSGGFWSLQATITCASTTSVSTTGFFGTGPNSSPKFSPFTFSGAAWTSTSTALTIKADFSGTVNGLDRMTIQEFTVQRLGSP